MTWVMTHSEARLGDRLVLLAIANHADAAGRAWPSIAAIASEARMSERQVQRAIPRLEAISELMIEQDPGPHGVHRFRLLGMGDKLSGVVLTEGDKLSEGVVTSCQGDGDKLSGVLPEMSPKPLEVSKKDSEANASGAVAPSETVADIFALGVKILGEGSRPIIGRARKDYGPLVTLEALLACRAEAPSEPVEFFMGCLRRRGTLVNPKRSPVEKMYAGGLAAADEWERRQRDCGADISPSLALLDSGRPGSISESADFGLDRGFGGVRH